jgi:hypothetical protein
MLLLVPQTSSPANGATAGRQQKSTSLGGTVAGEDACGPSKSSRISSSVLLKGDVLREVE